jgi:predicted TIM-barrel fold metal-dependent hydrolase
MKGKIALEEHFATEDTLDDSKGFFADSVWPELRGRLIDIHDNRLRQMDRHGVEMMILSLNAPAIQAIPDPARANDIARRANDFLAEQVTKRPDRFRALAALPMQEPELAATELTRCVNELGFKGGLVNGFSQIEDLDTMVYYDLPQYWPFWEVVEKLDVPFYLHPRNPLPSQAKIYQGHRWLLGPAWAFGQETAVHALRLMGSGLFDKYPHLAIILGHLGEGLPFSMWRVDNCCSWIGERPAHPAKKPIADYFRANFHITTSGNFRTQALINAMLEIGADRIMFSTDWPFENVSHAADWFDVAAISEADRVKIGRTNAIKLFRLDAASSQRSAHDCLRTAYKALQPTSAPTISTVGVAEGAERIRRAVDEVRHLDRRVIANPALAGVLEEIVAKYSFDVAVLDAGAKRGKRRELHSTQDDYGMGLGVSASVLDMTIPFRGDPESFDVAPSYSHMASYPCEVRNSELRFTVPDDESSQKRVDDFVRLVSDNLERLRAEVSNWLPVLTKAVKAVAKERMDAISRDRDRDKGLDFPVE